MKKSRITKFWYWYIDILFLFYFNWTIIQFNSIQFNLISEMLYSILNVQDAYLWWNWCWTNCDKTNMTQLISTQHKCIHIYRVLIVRNHLLIAEIKTIGLSFQRLMIRDAGYSAFKAVTSLSLKFLLCFLLCFLFGCCVPCLALVWLLFSFSLSLPFSCERVAVVCQLAS